MTFVSLQDLIIASPLIALAVFSILPTLVKVFMGNKEPNQLATMIYSVVGLVVSSGLTLSLWGVKQKAFSGAIVVDGISSAVSFLIFLITAVCIILAYENRATRKLHFAEFVFLIMNSAIGMSLLTMSNDLMMTFIAIEVMSLALYLLIAISAEPRLSKEAAFKYFLLGSLGSAILLYGIALVYGSTSTTDLTIISESVMKYLSTSRTFSIGVVLIILGFGFKVALFPMHSWTPDVYQGAATPVTAFMATAVKAASFVAFLRFFATDGFIGSHSIYTLMSWFIVLTITLGNVAALWQNNLKRMLAYSSIAHSGYASVAILAAAFGNNYEGAAASLIFYLFSYAFMTLGTFAMVSYLEKTELRQITLDDLKGLAFKKPLTAISLAVLLMSLGGVPPTLGFFAKLYVFSAAIEQNMIWLVVWAALNSAMSMYYYLKPQVYMFMNNSETLEVSSNKWAQTVVMLSAAAILLFGLFSSPLLKLVEQSVGRF